MRAAVLVVVLLLLVLGPASSRELRCDPITGKIRVLYMGDALGIQSPFPYIRMEPSFIAVPVEACTFHSTPEFMRKQMRYHMPRTSERLRKDYDVLILSDANRDVFRPQAIDWMSEAVKEDGLGIIMIGGAESFEGRGGIMPSWAITTVADVLPVNMLEREYCDQAMRMVIVDPDAELARSLPWNTLGSKGVFSEGHRTTLKQNAHLIAEAITFSYGRIPHLAWWDVGKGRGFAMMTDWTPAGGAIFMTWDYYPDFVLNTIMFSAGKKLPDDVDILYLIRRRIRNYWDIRSTLDTMVEIVDQFGGNFAAVERGALECDKARKKADELYFTGEYSAALDAYDEAIQLVEGKIEEARRIANQALFYVYLIEWAAVTGTSLLGGVVLYTLMVRRRLYAEVPVTKLERGES
mgnify:CR=1 FL=1